MARQRNNIYAIAADAVELAMDTAGTIGSVVGGMAHMVGIGRTAVKESEEHVRKEAGDAASRVAKTFRHEVDAAKPRTHKAKAVKKPAVKTHAPKSVKKVAKRRTAKKAA